MGHRRSERGSGASEVENQRWRELLETNGNIYVAWKTREQALAAYQEIGSLGWGRGDWGAQRVVVGSQWPGKTIMRPGPLSEFERVQSR